MRKMSLLSILTIVSVACLGTDFAASVEGPWQMTAGTVDGEEIPLLDSHPITINFEDGEVHGTAACNGYSGTFQLSASEIFSSLGMTEMACSPEETMEAEAMFAAGITRVDTVEVDGQLTLSGDDVEMVFEPLEPVPDAGLTGTRWVLDGLIQGDTVSTPVLDTEAFIQLFEDNTLVGDTGCRPFSGQYTISGAEVVVTELAADGHQCEDPLADQDNRFISAIEGGFRVEIEEGRLTTWGQGDEGLTFIAGD